MLTRGHSIHLLHDYSQTRDGVKGGYFPALFSAPQFENEITFIGTYHSSSDIIDFVLSRKIEVVYSLNSWISYNVDIKRIRPCKWVVLQHWGDNFAQGPETVFQCDHFLSYSEYWWNSFLNSTYYRNASVIPDPPEVQHIGHPLNFLILELDKEQIKNKYNLCSKKGVLTYLPIGTPYMYCFKSLMQKIWLVYHYSSIPKKKFLHKIISYIASIYFKDKQTKVNEKNIVLSIKHFCSRNNLTFVVKTRFKTPISKFIEVNADVVYYDETFYPATITELMFVSDIVVSHLSMASFEAIAMKAYTININLRPVYGVFAEVLNDLFDNKWVDDFNTDGLGTIIDGDTFANSFSKEDIENFRFNDGHYIKFMNKYFGGTSPDNFKKTLSLINYKKR